MVTRMDATGRAYGLNEAISREQALRLYTSAASHYTFEELDKGTLEEGKFADMAVLSGDPMTVPEKDIKDITAELTVVNGRVVFSGGSFAAEN
ncbi:amidohydrolase family protein [Bradyrhizobium japonicum]